MKSPVGLRPPSDFISFRSGTKSVNHVLEQIVNHVPLDTCPPLQSNWKFFRFQKCLLFFCHSLLNISTNCNLHYCFPNKKSRRPQGRRVKLFHCRTYLRSRRELNKNQSLLVRVVYRSLNALNSAVRNWMRPVKSNVDTLFHLLYNVVWEEISRSGAGGRFNFDAVDIADHGDALAEEVGKRVEDGLQKLHESVKIFHNDTSFLKIFD